MNLNKAFIIGNLTRDPELKTLPSGTSVASFSMATNRIWKSQTGEKQTDVQFHNIVAFGRQAEIAHQYLKKGSMTLVEGRIQTRTWDGPDGTKKNRTEIVVERLQLGPRRNGENFDSNTPPAKKTGSESETLDTIEYPEENNSPDEIPF